MRQTTFSQRPKIEKERQERENERMTDRERRRKRDREWEPPENPRLLKKTTIVSVELEAAILWRRSIVKQRYVRLCRLCMKSAESAPDVNTSNSRLALHWCSAWKTKHWCIFVLPRPNALLRYAFKNTEHENYHGNSFPFVLC